MKKSVQKLGNAGFSLVELIIGVFILAIIVGPLLNAFLVSARTTARAKETRNQTVAAQNIVETLDAVSLGELLQNMGNPGYTLGSIAKVSGLYTTDVNGEYIPANVSDYTDGETSYCFGLTDVSDKYDALVELSADPVTNLSDQIVVDTQMEAVFTQPSGDGGPDRLAAEEFAQLARIDSGDPNIDINNFLHNMKRTVTIRVVKNAGEGEAKIVCSAQYHYEAKFSWDIYDTTKSPAKYLSTQTVTYTKDYDDSAFYNGSAGEDGRLSVYFFFYPNYYTPDIPDFDDIFDIYNLDDLKLDIFLIKQKTPNPAHPQNDLEGLAGYENSYKARVYIRQSANAQLDLDMLNTNINENLAGADSPLIGSDFRIYKGTIPFKPPNLDGTLVKTEKQNRLYNVTVTLYKNGERFTGADPLMTFDASIIE